MFVRYLTVLASPPFPSQKDLEDLKAEVQRRQQLQEAIRSSEQLEPEDSISEERETETSTPSAEVPPAQDSA